MTDERFEEALRAVPERLSKKRGMSPECDSEAEASTGQRQQSKKKKTVRFAETEGSGSQIGEFFEASYPFDSPC